MEAGDTEHADTAKIPSADSRTCSAESKVNNACPAIAKSRVSSLTVDFVAAKRVVSHYPCFKERKPQQFALLLAHTHPQRTLLAEEGFLSKR